MPNLCFGCCAPMGICFCSCTLFCNQVQILQWKNRQIRLRNWKSIILEVCIPVLIVLALGGLRALIKPVTSKADIPFKIKQYNTGFHGQYTYDLPQCSGENLVFRCVNGDPDRSSSKGCTYLIPSIDVAVNKCQQKKIAIVPADGASAATKSAAQAMVSSFNSIYGNNITYKSAHPSQGYTFNSFKYYESEAALQAHIKGSKYSFTYDVNDFPIIGAAVVLKSAYPAWDYTVRLNVTMTRYGFNSYSGTDDQDIDLSVRSNVDSPTMFGTYADVYFGNYYVALTDIVNSHIITDTCVRAGNCPHASLPTYVNLGDKVVQVITNGFRMHTAGGANFPAPEVTSVGFFSQVGSVFSLLIILGLSFPIANVASILVKEKESKIREGMKMMAMKSEALWLSWWLHFLEFFFPLAIVLAIFSIMLFKYSGAWYIFTYFFFFLVASTAFAIFVSNFFTNSRTAVIVNFLLYIGGYFIFVGLESNSEKEPSRSSRLAACLHPSAALSYATLGWIEYEDSGVGLTQFTSNISNKNNITFDDCMGFLVLDALYLSLLAWYVDKIWPSEFGTQLPWYFPFQASYWQAVIAEYSFFNRHKRNRPAYNRIAADSFIEMAPLPHGTDDDHRQVPSSNPNVEGVPELMHSQVLNKKCVHIQGLYKEFITPQGFKKVAVDNLNLTMYSGQITALLGHNGAGKTTTIAMLTGLLPVGGGDAFIEGLSVTHDMDAIRRNLGVCPQHDILFADLTVEEHLILFASFKGMKGKAIMEEVEKMIQSVGLTEKRHVFSKQLSGGQKRKLSVGIAFIAGSRIVFLDEPTSGMDPYSRRFTWNVIRQHREGRVVVLTTHFMDEADLLGDRIAIMGDGRLACCGSSLFLKRQFGVGYNITLEKQSSHAFNSAGMTNTIVSRIPEATLLTDVGTEMTFQLPFAASKNFKALFEHIDSNLASLGLISYGMSVTTLEEVFIKITQSTHTLTEAQNGKNMNKVALRDHAATDDVEKQAHEALIDPTLLPYAGAFKKIDENDHLSYFLRHVGAILTKRFLYFIRDKKAILFVIVLPFLFMLLGEILLTQTDSTFPDEEYKSLSYTRLNSRLKDKGKNVLPTAYAADNAMCIEGMDSGNGCRLINQAIVSSYMANVKDASKLPLQAVSSIRSIRNMSEYLYAHRNDYQASQYGAYSFLNDSSTIPASSSFILHTNYTAIYGVPIFGAMLADSVARSFDSTVSVNVGIHPMPYTLSERRFDNLNLILIPIFIMVAIPFVPAAAASFIVREREVKSKHQQIVSGVGISAYWIANFMWDNLVYMLTLFLFVALITGPLFGKDAGKLGGNGNLYECQYLFGLLYLFGFSMFGFTYLVSFMFTTPSAAQVILIFITFIMGVVLALISNLLLRYLPDTQGYYADFLRYLFCLFPPFALADGIYSMVLISLFSPIELKGQGAYRAGDWKIAGIPLMMMGWESIVYLALTILFEYLSNIPSVMNLIVRARPLPPLKDGTKDSDVIAEEDRVASGTAHANSTILVKDFKKMYGTGKYAVKGVSLGIPNGECFGLLGINGAGKSTTLSMLSGEFPPTAGEAYLAGLNLLTDIHTCRRKIGFCPQFDALFEFLTGREHLELYARIKGIVESDVSNVVETKIREMGLTEYADRYAGTYSGGNKRKLSVAIAMIGEPSIVFLDEPSTGMDPVARRFMWDVITDIVTKKEKCSLILTTHSMEECEALCTRIGIMVGGVLRCLGSAQHLRSRYGDGFQIEVGIHLPSTQDIEMYSQTVAMPYGGKVMTRSQLDDALKKQGKEQYCSRISADGSGADILYTLNTNVNKEIEASQVASWWILEELFDEIEQFFMTEFGEFNVTERQAAKLRIKIKATEADGSPRQLSKMFGAIEEQKERLKIDNYSISQTSLEQIFNSFASQQEEELGKFNTR